MSQRHVKSFVSAKPFPAALPIALACALALGGCSSFKEDKVDYTSAKRVNTLEVPPDLTQLNRETRYAVPGSVVTASGYQASAPKDVLPVAAKSAGDVRLEKAGTQRWLVVNRPADKLWGPVTDFWKENGFALAVEQQNLGLIETDWAENRAKLPQDVIRTFLSKIADNLYDTGERDKFRTRLERAGESETEIFISHRGMVEVYTNTQKDRTVWQPRAADPALEDEFLRRLMLKLGVTQEAAKAQLAAAAALPKARLVGAGTATASVEMDEPFDRAWRRVGVALDRTGFTVEDRDRNQGIYYVRYVEAVDSNNEPGLLSKLFGATKQEAKPQQYRVLVRSSQSNTVLNVLTAQGDVDSSSIGQRILKVLADDLQ